MKSSRLPLLILAASAVAVALTVGCTSATRHRWLTTFFDGVPPEHPATNIFAVAHSTNAEEVVQVQQAIPPKPAEPVYFGHKPFTEDKCASCHESQFAQGLKKKTPGLCFDCHKDFLTTAKVKHQPVESGDCKSCHDPHQSYTNRKLLVKTGAALCWECHDNFLEKAKVKHTPAENGECLSCHTAHAGDNKKLVLKSGAKLCWECHDNFLEKAKFRHDVADDCAVCHAAHKSDEPKLLLKNVGKLCLDCHEESDLKKVKEHTANPAAACMKCHEPHVGADKFLLKKGARGEIAK